MWRDLRQDLGYGVRLLGRAPGFKQILAAQAQALANHIAVQTRIAQVLTAEQRAKASERLAAEPGEGRAAGRGRR